MFPNMNYSGMPSYNMPQQGNPAGGPQMQYLYTHQQYGSVPQSQYPSSTGGTGNAGNVDVLQLVAALFQPIVDLLNASQSGQAPTEFPTAGNPGSDFQLPGQDGGEQVPGCGGQQFPGLGGPQIPGFGGPQFPGFGGPQTPGFGGQQFPGFGVPQTPGFGGQQIPGFGGQQPPDQASQALQILTQDAEALSMFDKNEDESLSRSELLAFSKSDETGISADSKAAAGWLAGAEGKAAFDKLDGYGGAAKDGAFDVDALPLVANDDDLTAETGIQNGQDALYTLNDEDLLEDISRPIEGSDRPVIDFTKLEELSKSEGDTYTDKQKEAATFVLEHEDLKKKLDDNNDGNFFADMVGKLLDEDPSLSEIAA